jgi:phosphoribosylamine--glycine ligase
VAVERYIRPIVDTMRAKGQPFVGVLYAGLILTEDGPKVLEYNVRFGDPECQPLMTRLDADLAAIMLACVNGRLPDVPVAWKPDTSVCVVMAAKGYPGAYAKGMTIGGIAAAETDPAVTVFQAGTKLAGDRLVTSGGRVLGVTALGDNLSQARERAYAAVEKIHFDGAVYRRDIGAKGLKWEPR